MKLIVSFHTPDPGYAHSSNYLRSSLERLKLPHAIVERPPLDPTNWARNNHIKPSVIREFHRGGKHGVLWVDGDSIVWQDPWYLVDALCDGFDVGAIFHRHKAGDGRVFRSLFASTIYFAPTAKAADCLDDWIARCDAGANVTDAEKWNWKKSDQNHLQKAIEHAEQHHELKCVCLPRNLAFIHDVDRDLGVPDPVIIEAFRQSYVGRVEDGVDHARGIARTHMPGLDHSVTLSELAASERLLGELPVSTGHDDDGDCHSGSPVPAVVGSGQVAIA